jgi:hypothetical protein
MKVSIFIFESTYRTCINYKSILHFLKEFYKMKGKKNEGSLGETSILFVLLKV